MGKGSRPRPRLISNEVADLRYELAFQTQGNDLRKEEILEKLKQLEKNDEDIN